MTDPKTHEKDASEEDSGAQADVLPKEIGGPKGLDPTRYGDWEIGGKCVDF